MPKIEIIPAIDIIGGKCVRLKQGDYNQKTVYSETPLEVALMFQDAGLNRLHLVDLDGAKAKQIINYKVLETIASKTSLIIDFGGGLKSDDDLKVAFECGASMVTGGSIAVKEPDVFIRWIEEYGSEKIMLGADAKDCKISISGWQEESSLEIIQFIKSFVDKGISKVISTDISKDGMLQGPSFDLFQQILENFPKLYLVASGGISGMNDILKLAGMNVPAVIIGKAIYEGKIRLKELERFVLE